MSTVFGLTLRTLATRARLLGLGAIGVIAVLIGFAIRADDFGRAQSTYEFVDGFGLGLLAPVVALVFAAAALGDAAEDGTLVYLWLRPIARWRVTLAALAATWCVAIPVAVVPVTAAAAISDAGGDIVAAAAAATAIAVVGYSGLFLGLGLWVRRALVWGIAYVLIWEGVVARTGTAPARLSVLVYAKSLLASMAGEPPPAQAASEPIAVIVPLVVTAVAWALTTWSLGRAEPA